jgi:hypothetical protein
MSIIPVYGCGTQVSIIASNTFPIGVLLTDFADDEDVITNDDVEIQQVKIGANGNILPSAKPVLINVGLAVVPDSSSDIQLAILLESNRFGFNKQGSQDVITMSIIQPNNKVTMYYDGFIVGGSPSNKMSAEARFKTKKYNFMFGNKTWV